MPNHLRVLIVEDNEDDAEFLIIALRNNGYEVSSQRVETEVELRAALERREWDLILSDYSLPHFSAPAALSLVKQRCLDIPFIVVTGTMGEDVAVATMRSGVSDYLTKDNLARWAGHRKRIARYPKSPIASRRRTVRPALGGRRPSLRRRNSLHDAR